MTTQLRHNRGTPYVLSSLLAPVRPVGCLGLRTPCGRLGSALLGGVTAALLATAAAQTAAGQPPPAQPVTVETVIRGIEEGHARLLRHPSGFGIQYRLTFEPNPKQKQFFVWQQGMDGVLNVRWPEVRCRVEGPMSGLTRIENGVETEMKPTHHVRQGSFNFETFTGVEHDGNLNGHIGAYRNPFSASSGYPLRFQCYAEMDQRYESNARYTSDYWLPHALHKNPYRIVGSEPLDGIPCLILVRDGIDKMWVATNHNHIVCKREYAYGVGQPLRESTRNTHLKEVAPGLWLPMRQVREEFVDDPPGELMARYVIDVTQVRLGDLSDSDVRVEIPQTVERIEDSITGKLYRPGANVGREMDDAVQQARASNLAMGSSTRRTRMWTYTLGGLVVALGLANAKLYFYRTRRNAPGAGALARDQGAGANDPEHPVRADASGPQ